MPGAAVCVWGGEGAQEKGFRCLQNEAYGTDLKELGIIIE